MLDLDPKGIVAIHASAIFNQEGTLLFLGPSGTGKTTACNLFSPHMDMLAEDAVYLVPRAKNGWEVFCGDKLAHTETIQYFLDRAYELPHVPLRAVLRLRQAEAPRVEKIDTLLTCRCLTDAFFEVVQQRKYAVDVKQRAFFMLAKVSRSLNGYMFDFDLSSRTPKALNQKMKLW